MDLKKIISTTMMLVMCSFLFVSVLMSRPTVALADMSVATYCQLTIKNLEQQVNMFNELLVIVDQNSSDRNELIRQEELKKPVFAQQEQVIFNSFGVSKDEFVFYRGKYSKEVDKYLENNSDISLQIQNLSSIVSSRFDQYEFLKGKVGQDAPPLP